MKRLDRYLLKEMAVPMLWGTLAVTFMFLAFYLFAEYNMLQVQTLSTVERLEVIVCQIPRFIQMTIPVGVALGGAMGMSRLARESELTVMRGSGVKITRAVLPIAWAGLAWGLIDYCDADYLMPKAEKTAARLLNRTNVSNLQSDEPLKLRDLSVYIGSAVRIAPTEATFHNVLLMNQLANGSEKVVRAVTGEYIDGLFRFHSDYEWTVDKGVVLSAHPRKSDSEIKQTIVLDELFGPPLADQDTASELWKIAQDQRKLGQRASETEVKYYSRFSVPAACVIFGIVSPLLAARFAKGGSVAGIILSVFLVGLYYNVYMISTDVFGKLEWINPLLAAWLPNLLFVAIGVAGLRKLE